MTGERAYMEAWSKEGPSTLRETHADGEYFDPSAARRKQIERMRNGDYDLPPRQRTFNRIRDDDDRTPRIPGKILPFDCL